MFTEKLSWKYRDSIRPPTLPRHTRLPLLWSSGPGTVRSSQSDRPWLVIVSPSPRVTLGSTLGAVPSMSWSKCVMTGVHSCSFIRGSFMARKSPVLCLITSPAPSQATTGLFAVSVAPPPPPSVMSWNHTGCSLFRRAPFTEEHAFAFPPCLFIAK